MLSVLYRSQYEEPQRIAHVFSLPLSFFQSLSHNKHDAIIDKHGAMSSPTNIPSYYKCNSCGHHFGNNCSFRNHFAYSKRCIRVKPQQSLVHLHLLLTGECRFDLTLKGARLRPIRFGSRRCTPQEQHYHSFVGEAAVGRWAINQNRKYLWGASFYWLCDCSGVKEILEYDGPIHQVRRWAQELLGYCFHIVHRPARMRWLTSMPSRVDTGPSSPATSAAPLPWMTSAVLNGLPHTILLCSLPPR